MSLLFKLYPRLAQRLLNPSRSFSSTSPRSNLHSPGGAMKWGVFPSPIGLAEALWRTHACRESDGRRARQDSPTEMTDSKRRLTDPNELWTDPNEFSSLYNRLSTICEGLPSDIISLLSEDCIGDLADAILKDSQSGGFFELALELLLKLDEDRPRISGDEFSLLVSQVWLNPILVHGLRSVMEKDWDLLTFVTSCAIQYDLPTDRMAKMEADICFKPCLMAIKSASRNSILRVFLSILIGYWGDKGQFTELDKIMGKDFLGRRMETMAECQARARKEPQIVDLSFDIKDISDAKDLEPLRQLLETRYGVGGEVDVEDILEKAKNDLPGLLNISLNHFGYGGKKATIEISLFDGTYGSLHGIDWS